MLNLMEQAAAAWPDDGVHFARSGQSSSICATISSFSTSGVSWRWAPPMRSMPIRDIPIPRCFCLPCRLPILAPGVSVLSLRRYPEPTQPTLRLSRSARAVPTPRRLAQRSCPRGRMSHQAIALHVSGRQNSPDNVSSKTRKTSCDTVRPRRGRPELSLQPNPSAANALCQPRDHPFSKDFAASSTYSPPSTIQIASWRPNCQASDDQDS